MGCGLLRDVPLAEARAIAAAAREHVRSGRDPIAERERIRLATVGIPTFGEVADDLIANIEHGFRNEKHKAQLMSWAYCNRFGNPNQKQPLAYAAALSECSTRLGRKGSAWVRIPRGGQAT